MKHWWLVLALSFAFSMVGCVDDGGEASAPSADGAVSADVAVTPSERARDSAAIESTTDATIEAAADTATGVTTDVMLEDAVAGGTDSSVSEVFGEPCETDADCQGEPCVQTANGGACSQECEDTCPEGWSCLPPQGAGSDGAVCLADFATLCMPCSSNAECDLSNGSGDERCIPRGDAGSFCGGGCDAKGCPAGYVCEEVADLSGEVSRQCVKEDGVCECSPLAKSTKASTPCVFTNAFGSCPGDRQCSDTGLSDCEGPQDSVELCDDVDNDCDGQTDEGFPNTDGTGFADCLDDDDDDDGVVDALDCAPLDPAVFPTCTDKQCGDDGCGADCGTCEGSALCVDNQCVCQPNCNGKACGDDGCGGSCGGCGGNGACVNHQCVCQPSCDGKACGDDGCGGSCGGCDGNDTCLNHQCVCLPNCLGLQCGDDGCGGSCGSCEGGDCVNGICTCQPDCEGKVCGDDGCGGICGVCVPDRICVPTPSNGAHCICDNTVPGWCPIPGAAFCTGPNSANACVPVGTCAIWADIPCFGGCWPGGKSDVCL